MSGPRAHVALLVDFANLRQQIRASAVDAPEGDAPTSDAVVAESVPPGSPTPVDSQTDDSQTDDSQPAPLTLESMQTGQIARSLVRFAGTVGRVGVARAYADWSREPKLARELNGTRLAPVLVPATEDGEDRSHIRLTVDAMETLYNGDEPDAFVIVSSDPSLVPLVQAIRADGSEVILVAADEKAADEMRAESDQFASFQDVLDGAAGEPVRPRSFAERDRGGSRERGAGTSRGESGSDRAQGGREDDRAGGRDRGYYSSTPLLTEPEFGDYDWEGFIRLIDELEQRLPFVGVRYLVNKVLGPHNCGIEDPHIKRDLINEAVDDGLIEMYAVGNVNDRTDPVTACRLDRRNPRVAATLGPDLADDDADAEADLLPEDAAGEFSATAP